MKAFLEQLEGNVNRQNELLAIRSGKAVGISKRELNDDESTEFDLLEEEITSLKTKIDRQTKFDESAKRNAGVHFSNVEQKESKDLTRAKSEYSLVRAIGLRANGKQLDGVEAEMQQEAEREAKDRGVSLEGVSLPSFMMDLQKRDLTVGTAATAGNLVQTDLGAVVPALRPRLKVAEMGATILSGLVGNLDLPIGNALASAAWEGENDTTAETTPSTTLLSLRPNRLAAFTDISKQLLSQSSTSVEAWVRAELSNAIARAVDAAAINGSGSSNQPTGILNTAGIGDVAMGTNGGVPTNAALIALETAIAIDNADVENMGYLFTPGVRGVLKNTALAANNSGFIWDGRNSNINGYRAEVSTQVPSTLTKGSTSGTCHAILMGNFADLVIANWGMVDILVNPYTKAKEGLVELVVNSYWDIGVKHASSFAAIKDATLVAP